MSTWLTEPEFAVLTAACDRVVPATGRGPGAVAAGVPDYIDGLLGAFLVDPPRIWARGPTSGRFGGEEAFAGFHPLSPMDELAWRTRIEGSQGRSAREFNGPVVGLQERYRSALDALGADFCRVGPEEQDARLAAVDGFGQLLFHHCCEGLYGAPEYGGNRDGAAWAAIDFAGDVQPRGWTDTEVSEP